MSVEELQDKQDRQRRNSLLLILLLLLLGVICMCLAGQAAIKLAPTWAVEADMGSGLDPNVDYALKSNPDYIEPVLPGILEDPDWMDVFLTPGAVIPKSLEQQLVVVPPTEQSPITQVPAQNTPTPTDNPLPTVYPTTIVVPPTQPPILKPPKPPKPPEPPPEPPSADLAITKTDNIGGSYTTGTGTAITYTIEITNGGPGNASGFIITDNVPAEIINVSLPSCAASGSASCGTDNTVGSAISYTGASIDAGFSNKITITYSGTVDPLASGTITNIANLDTSGSPTFTDGNTSNNSASYDISEAVVLPETDLAISKAADVATFSPDDNITYMITVNNNGLYSASGFDIIDNVPTSVDNVSVNCTVTSGTANCGTNNTSGNAVSFTGASIDAGGELTITVAGTVAFGTTGTISNTASIDTSGSTTFTDSNTGNNSATETINPRTCTFSGSTIVVPVGGCLLVQSVTGNYGNLYAILGSTGGGNLQLFWFGLDGREGPATCSLINKTYGAGVGHTLNGIYVANFFGNTFLVIGNQTGDVITLDITESAWNNGGCN